MTTGDATPKTIYEKESATKEAGLRKTGRMPGIAPVAGETGT
jgi:hypothetical protein